MPLTVADAGFGRVNLDCTVRVGRMAVARNPMTVDGRVRVGRTDRPIGITGAALTGACRAREGAREHRPR